MTPDVSEELERIRDCIVSGHFNAALEAIERAEKAWQIEVDLWADALLEAHKALK